MEESERQVKRRLPVPLTGKEFEARAVELAKCHDQIAEIEAKKKEANDEFKRQVGTVVSRKNELRVAIQERREDREVECEWRENFRQKCWELWRLDTNKKVDTMAMTAEDLQGSLPGTDKPPDKKDKKEPADKPGKKTGTKKGADAKDAGKGKSNKTGKDKDPEKKKGKKTGTKKGAK